jgi:hypothetical protein
LIFHQGEIGVYGVDADWILPSPGPALAEEPEMPVDPEPKTAMSPEPIPRFWRWLRDRFGTE